MSVAIDTYDNTTNDPTQRAPLVTGGQDFASVTDMVCRIPEAKTPRAWFAAFAITSALTVYFFILIGYLIGTGIGVWGNNSPVFWAFDITNFVFWIGIGHAGTLISAILFLLRQKWRTSINRCGRSHDHLRRDLRIDLPRHPHGPDLVRLLAGPVSEPDVAVAEFPQPAALGRVCGYHVLYRVLVVLVPGHDSRPGHVPRPGDEQVAIFHLRHAGPGLARIGPAVARVRMGVFVSGRAGHAAGDLACTRW